MQYCIVPGESVLWREVGRAGSSSARGSHDVCVQLVRPDIQS